MAAIFFEPGTGATGGFEFYTSAIGEVSSETTVVRNGGRSIKQNTSNPAVSAAVQKNGVLSDAGRRISTWIRFPSVSPSTNTTILNCQNSLGNACIALQISTAGNLRFTGPGATASAGSTVLIVDTWYRVSFSYLITSASSWEVRVYLNGQLEITRSSNGVLTNTGTDRLLLSVNASAGTNFIGYFSDTYIDDDANLTDPGNINVTAKRPAVDNTVGWDLPIGSDPGAGLRYQTVNDVPIDAAVGREHRGIGFVAAGSLATNATTTTLTITAPAVTANDIMLAFVHGNNNQVVTPPSGWASIVEINNTANMRSSIFWKRAVSADSGATFDFTKPTDDNLLFAGVISAWKGCRIDDTPIDATTPTTSANASSDTVTYADFNPTESQAFVIAAGFYNNDNTTAGAISGTDPTFTNRVDLETTVGADCSIFVYDGLSTGAATGARSHATTSTADAINTGIMFGLVPQTQDNYTLQTASQGDADIGGGTIVSRMAWISAKASTGSSGTPQIIDNGSGTDITLTTSYSLFTLITDSASYPSNAAGIGMRSTGNEVDTFFSDGGTTIVYIPAEQSFLLMPPMQPPLKTRF